MRSIRGIQAVALGALAAALVLASAAQARPGDLYVTDFDGGEVFRVDPVSGQVTPVTTGSPLTFPAGITFAPDGSLLVADYEALVSVTRVDPDTGETDLLSGDPVFGQATGIDVGPGNRILVTDQESPSSGVYRVDSSTGAATPVSTGGSLLGPTGIAAPPTGPLLVADREAERLFSVALGGGQTELASLPGDPDLYGLDRAPDGTVYVADTFAGIRRLQGDALPLIASDAPLVSPYGVVVAPSGRLFAVDYSAGPNLGAVIRVDPATGAATTVTDSAAIGGPVGIAIEPPRCGGRPATIVGSTGRDTLRGSRFADVIAALGGRDTVRGLGGRDVICGGGGRDKLLGGAAGDRLLGGAGRDRLKGGGGRDRCKGGPGSDLQLGC